jgi:hypothetical protein
MIAQKWTRHESNLFLDWIDNGQILSQCPTIDLSSIVKAAGQRQFINQDVFLKFNFEFGIILLIVYFEDF